MYFAGFGPQKTTFLEVPRALEVSHGSIYRHFESKSALLDAVVENWLRKTPNPLLLIPRSDEQSAGGFVVGATRYLLPSARKWPATPSCSGQPRSCSQKPRR